MKIILSLQGSGVRCYHPQSWSALWSKAWYCYQIKCFDVAVEKIADAMFL